MRSVRLGSHARDRGAAMIEYAALVVLVMVILVGLLSAGLPGALGKGINGEICRVFGDKGCASRQHGSAHGHGQNGGESASRQTPTSGNPITQFGGGILGGLASAFGNPGRAMVVPPGPSSGGKSGVRKGGDRTSNHNIAARAAKKVMQRDLERRLGKGKVRVTVDCEPGGRTANCVPEGSKKGNGRNGYVDILRSDEEKDPQTGEKVKYIREVKSASRRNAGKGRDELERYQRILQANEDRKGTGVRIEIDDSETEFMTKSKNGNPMRVSLHKDGTVQYEELKGGDEKTDPNTNCGPTASLIGADACWPELRRGGRGVPEEPEPEGGEPVPDPIEW